MKKSKDIYSKIISTATESAREANQCVTTRQLFFAAAEADRRVMRLFMAHGMTPVDFPSLISFILAYPERGEAGMVSVALSRAIKVAESSSDKISGAKKSILQLLLAVLCDKDCEMVQLLEIINVNVSRMKKELATAVKTEIETQKNMKNSGNIKKAKKSGGKAKADVKKDKSDKNNKNRDENPKIVRGRNGINGIMSIMMGDIAGMMAGAGSDGVNVMADTEGEEKSMLESYAVNLTDEARAGRLDPLIGREEEMIKLEISLLRRVKNNPVLLGEAGVGKTAIVEGLAQKAAKAKRGSLRGVDIYSVDLAAMVAGTKYRGEFEVRLKGLIAEAEENKKSAILFIDEIHTMVGAGATSGSMDASNIMKTSLARGKIRLIGATTQDEWKFIEDDPALLRRFQPLHISEPTAEDTKKIVIGLLGKYEEHHGVKMNKKLVPYAVDLTERFIANRQQPDKTLDVVDEAHAMVRKKRRKELTADDLDVACARVANIHLDAISDERERYKNLEKDIGEVVKGQDSALKTIAGKLRLAKNGIRRAGRPLATFLLAGTESVGKATLANELADVVFPEENSILRLDMSEFRDAASVTSLLGVSAGYVGYDDNPRLEFVRRKPYCMILFEGLEKAHRDVVNIVNQIVMNGSVTDMQDREISFEHAIVVMTVNVPKDVLQQNSELGFGTSGAKGNDEGAKIKKVLKEMLPQNLLNASTVVPCSELTEKAIKDVAKAEIEQMTASFAEEYGVNVKVSASALGEISKRAKSSAEVACQTVASVLEELFADENFAQPKLTKKKILMIGFAGGKFSLR